MSIDIPTFEDGYGLTCCVCGEIEATDSTLKQQKAQVAECNTPQGQIFVRAWIDTKPRQILFVNWADSACFNKKEKPPKTTTDKMEDVFRIIESAYGLSVRATVCASFRVLIAELPESGLIRPLLRNGKGADVSIQMTEATFALTGLPISRLKWHIVNTKEDDKLVHIDLKGHKKFRVSDAYVSDAWRWIHDQFAIFVLGHGRIDSNSKPE